MSMLKRFCDDTRANVTLMFGLSALPLMLIAGGAIDYASSSKDAGNLQAAADAAVLAGIVDGIADKKRAEAAVTYFNKNTDPDLLKTVTSVKFKYDKNTGAGELKVTADVPTSFTRLVGKKSWAVAVKSAAISRPTVPRVLDVAMCIDITGSMTPTINAVRNSAVNFERDVNAELSRRNLPKFDAVRVRVSGFRDYGGNYRYNANDGWYVDKFPNGWVKRPANIWTNLGDDEPMTTSPYYNLPSDGAAFQNFVGAFVANGGGDNEESSIECVNEGLNANWLKKGDPVPGQTRPAFAVYPLIVLWTDHDGHPPSDTLSLRNPNYPPASIMPRDYDGLRAKWMSSARLDQDNKLLVTFAPTGGTPELDSLRAWPNYFNGGSWSDGNTNMVKRIVDAIAALPPNRTPSLTQ